MQTNYIYFLSIRILHSVKFVYGMPLDNLSEIHSKESKYVFLLTLSSALYIHSLIGESMQ